MRYEGKQYWALILGGSSGFGLASAKKLASEGMNICIVHRDRRGSMSKIEQEFSEIRNHTGALLTFNLDALSEEGRKEVLSGLKTALGIKGRVRLLLHSIAFGNLKPLHKNEGAASSRNPPASIEALALRLGVETDTIKTTINELFAEGHPEFLHLADAPDQSGLTLGEEDIANTIYAMGASIFSWVRDVHAAGIFADDARVIGMTSEGNEVAWRGYAAVSAAKVTLESISRSIALEYAPQLRSNIVQAGVTDTPALRLIPGSSRMLAAKQLSNPMGRTTRPEDVANVISLLCTDEAAWINGDIIRVDGGERIAG